MIVWQGAGIVALLIPALIVGVGQGMTDKFLGKGYAASHHWVTGLLLLASALAVAVVGYLMNRPPAAVRALTNGQQNADYPSRHKLFWIPVQYISILLVASALYHFFFK